jgi:hypothetical protein
MSCALRVLAGSSYSFSCSIRWIGRFETGTEYVNFAVMPGASARPEVSAQSRLIATSMLPRVAREYGHIWSAASTSR